MQTTFQIPVSLAQIFARGKIGPTSDSPIHSRVSKASADGFLPDFCRGSALINIALLAELIALAVTVLTRRLSPSIFQDFVLISLFVQWVALSSAATLCLLRRYLNRLPAQRAAIMAYLVLLGIAMLISELALWVLAWSETIVSPRPVWYGYYHLQNFIVIAVVDLLAFRYFLAQHQLRQRVASEAKAQIEVQKDRIRRHFLYNSLNNIAGVMHRSTAKAETAIEDLSELVRVMADDDREVVPLAREIELARKYIKLEKLRFGRRLLVNWQIGSYSPRAKTIVLLLQPLLEYAIRVGVEPAAKSAKIDIRISQEDEWINLGVDFTKVISDKIAAEEVNLFTSIRSRLQTHFSADSRLSQQKNADIYSILIEHPIAPNNE